MGGGRNLATYPRCPRCHRKRDVSSPRATDGLWWCCPCNVFFRVIKGYSVADGGAACKPYSADIKEIAYCHRHFCEYVASRGCSRCLARPRWARKVRP
jgi:hypothetical protein